MRCLGMIVALSLLAACNKGGGEPIRLPDGSTLSSSNGEVQLADGTQMQFVITSERYKQWEAAKSGLNPEIAARFGVLLKPQAPTEKTIASAVAYLQSQSVAKQAIERTGMSVRDFVQMTVALEQEMRIAAARASGRVPVSTTPAAPLPRDTFVTQAPLPPLPPPTPYPTPVDTTFRRDSAYAPTRTPRPAPTPRVDTVRRDTLLVPPKRDTTKREPAPRDTAPARRDTARPPRDTTPAPPKDTSSVAVALG